jgi:hypothetical protein
MDGERKEYEVLLYADHTNQYLLMWKEELKEIAKCVNYDGWPLASDLNVVN